MVNKGKALLQREIKGLHEAAYLLAFFSILSQLFALIRDRLLASAFGTSLQLDIYYAAFKLPDILFVVVASLVSISVLVPQFVKYLDDKEKLKRIVNSIFTVLALISVVSLALAFIFAPKFLQLIVPDLLNSDLGNELILITRILLLQPIFLATSAFMGSLVQAYKRFTIYAFAPILYNLGIIFGILVLYPMYGIAGLAYGVVVGSLLHLFIQVPFIFDKGIYPKLTFKIDFKEIYYIAKHSFPRTAAVFANQGVLIFMTYLASTMVFGSLSTFNLSYNLQSVPLAVIGVSYSLAAFPALSKFFHKGEMDKFFTGISKALRHIIFWSFPIMAMFVVLRAQIVRVILGSGNFDWDATRLVAASLAIFTISIFAQSISLLFLRAYYAMGKTLRPFLITLVLFGSIVGSSFFFVELLTGPFSTQMKELLRLAPVADVTVLALPMAFSFGQIIYMILLIVCFGSFRKIVNRELVRTTWHSISASLVAFLVTFLSLNVFDKYFDLNTFWGVFGQGSSAGILGLIAAFLYLVVIQNREVKIVMKTLHTKFWRTKPISPEVEEEL
jgi:putative peptidoglycan lipid II flippase